MGPPTYRIDSRTCRTWLAFETKNGVYYAGYVKENGHFFGKPLARAEIAESVPVSSYYLCYDRDAADGTNLCRQIIWPQPEINEGTEPGNSKRASQMLAIADMNKETGADKTQYLAVNLVNPKSPHIHYHLHYRFLDSGDKAQFEASPETLKIISCLRSKDEGPEKSPRDGKTQCDPTAE